MLFVEDAGWDFAVGFVAARPVEDLSDLAVKDSRRAVRDTGKGRAVRVTRLHKSVRRFHGWRNTLEPRQKREIARTRNRSRRSSCLHPPSAPASWPAPSSSSPKVLQEVPTVPSPCLY